MFEMMIDEESWSSDIDLYRSENYGDPVTLIFSDASVISLALFV